MALTSFFSRSSGKGKQQESSAGQGDGKDPEPGNIYSFKTSGYHTFSPEPAVRYAAFKIIGLSEQLIAVAVLDGIWIDPPELWELRNRPVLEENRFAYDKRLAAFGFHSKQWKPSSLNECKFAGCARLSSQEKYLADKIIGLAVGSRISTFTYIDRAAEGEWRWINDREVFTQEAKRIDAENEARRKAHQEHYNNRLKNLNWDQMLSETPFERWDQSPPYPNAEFTTLARQRIHETCKGLKALGTRPPKAKVREKLRDCVEWFNIADDEFGGVIETEEREDICAILEEMAFVAKQRALVEEIDIWRTW